MVVFGSAAYNFKREERVEAGMNQPVRGEEK